MQMQITTVLSVFLSEWRLQGVLAIVKVKWILGICKFSLWENGRRWCWNNTGNLYNAGQLLIHLNKEWYIPQVLLLFFMMVLKEPIDSLAVGWVCAGFDAFLSSGAHVELSVQSWYFYLLQGLPPYPKHYMLTSAEFYHKQACLQSGYCSRVQVWVWGPWWKKKNRHWLWNTQDRSL